MADIFKNLFGGKAEPSQKPVSDDGFADFAGAPDPSPASVSAATPVIGTAPTGASGATPYVYTKWYRVWERSSPKDFVTEAFVVPLILILVLVHLWGTRTNRRKAKGWMKAHAPALQGEFAMVGYGERKAPSVDDVQSSGLLKALNSDDLKLPSELMKQKSSQEFQTYATGRQNVAYINIKLTMLKRYNPLLMGSEWIIAQFFDSVAAPVERIEAEAFTFDGREKELVPSPGNLGEVIETRSKGASSSYDGFVWGIVNKLNMRKLRDERYDVSLTSTKDHPKLPNWVTVMTEAAEVTEKLLTNELIKAIEEVGEGFEYLIITDQPLDKPKTLDETVPRKRLCLSMKMPGSSSTYESSLPLFNCFLRLPDHLASQASFRPEVMRRIKATREEETRKLKRVDEEEKQEERNTQRDKQKKTERDKKLRNMTSDEQKKFLDRERDKENRKQEKKMSRKG